MAPKAMSWPSASAVRITIGLGIVLAMAVGITLAPRWAENGLSGVETSNGGAEGHQARTPDMLLWTFDGGFQDWQPSNWASVDARDGVVVGTTNHDSQLLSPVLNIEAKHYAELVARVQSDMHGEGEAFFNAPGERMSDKKKAMATFPCRSSMPTSTDGKLAVSTVAHTASPRSGVDSVRSSADAYSEALKPDSRCSSARPSTPVSGRSICPIVWRLAQPPCASS